MTACNVVRFRVKPGNDEQVLKIFGEEEDLNGARRGFVIKTHQSMCDRVLVTHYIERKGNRNSQGWKNYGLLYGAVYSSNKWFRFREGPP